MDSLIALTGAVRSIKRLDHSLKFSLRNDDGLFFVQVADPIQVQAGQGLDANHQVYVVGHLHSFIFKRCNSHHVFVEATLILPLPDR